MYPKAAFSCTYYLKYSTFWFTLHCLDGSVQHETFSAAPTAENSQCHTYFLIQTITVAGMHQMCAYHYNTALMTLTVRSTILSGWPPNTWEYVWLGYSFLCRCNSNNDSPLVWTQQRQGIYHSMTDYILIIVNTYQCTFHFIKHHSFEHNWRTLS